MCFANFSTTHPPAGGGSYVAQSMAMTSVHGNDGGDGVPLVQGREVLDMKPKRLESVKETSKPRERRGQGNTSSQHKNQYQISSQSARRKKGKKNERKKRRKKEREKGRKGERKKERKRGR